MSLKFDEEETDHRLAAAAGEHHIDVAEETQPTMSPEILGSALRTLTQDTSVGTRWMAPPEESGGELREGEGQWQGPSPVDDSQGSMPGTLSC